MKLRLILSTLAVPASLVTPLLGQDVEEKKPSAGDFLDPLVVQAKKDEAEYRPANTAATGFRDQPVIDIPFSVATFSSEFIQDTQARTLLDITKNDPSISTANDALWYDRINVRGFYLGADAVRRNGLPINDQGNIALENKASVEVTKGLTGARNGITSPGGSINYVTKRPTDGPLTSLTTSLDGFGGYGAHADVSRRFGRDEQFGVRFNVAGEEIRSFLDEVEGDKKFISGAFDWRVSEKLQLDFEFEYQDRDITAAQSPSIFSFASIAEARAFFPRLDAETRPTQSWAREPNEQTYFSGGALYEFNDDWRLRLNAQSARLDREQQAISAANIQPNGDYDALLYYSPDQERKNTAWQAVIEGDFDTGVLSHQLTAGYDYIQRDLIFNDASDVDIGTGNLFSNPAIADPNLVATASGLRIRTEQHSIFLADTVSYGDWLQVLGGIRLTQFKNEDNFYGSPQDSLVEGYDENALTPTFGVVYKPCAELSFYGSYAEGIEQGGTAPSTFGGTAVTNANAVLDPLESTQYEAGVKYQLPGGALLTAALFRIDKGLEYVDGGNTFVQDGRQVHDGAEITLGGKITPELSVIAGLAYLDAEIKDSDDPTILGKRPQGVAEWQASAYADYDLSELLTGFSVNAGLYYVGEKAIDPTNTWMSDSYVRFDAGLRYTHSLTNGNTATYRLNVENVTDERYLDNTTFGALDFGSPRIVKLSATFDF